MEESKYNKSVQLHQNLKKRLFKQNKPSGNNKYCLKNWSHTLCLWLVYLCEVDACMVGLDNLVDSVILTFLALIFEMPCSRRLSSCFSSLSDKFSTESPTKCLHMGDKTIKRYTGMLTFSHSIKWMLCTRLFLPVSVLQHLDLVAQFRGFLLVVLLKIKQRVRGNDQMDLI